MRKLFLVMIIITMACGADAQGFSWGVRAGLNIPTMGEKSKGDAGFDYKSKTGFHVGVITDFSLSKSFYIQPGLYFTTKGTKMKMDETTLKANLSYLQIPVLASYRFDLGGNMKLHINAGPYVGYGIGGKIKGGGAKIDAFGTADEDSDEMKGGLKRFDFGLGFGAGVSYDKIYVGLNYDLGLSNIADKDMYGDDYKLRNRSFNISVGYNF